MRRALVALGLVLALATPARSDTDLTALANTVVTRAESAELHDIAHQRAVEIASDFSHNGQREGTAEILAYNQTGPARALEQWLGSPPHLAILLDPNLRLVGCGSHTSDGLYFAACVFTAGEPIAVARTPTPTPVGATPTAGATAPAPPAGTEPAPTPSPPVLLPDTATP